jgi:glycosyltransferase involved in cell wall biosynthesis
MRTVTARALTLDIYGVIQGPSDSTRRKQLENLAVGDARIRFMDPVPNDRVVPLLRQYDALAVPSQCLETGPMVVLEAFAAGVPVIGTRLGGIAELVTHGSDGLLVDAGSSVHWVAVFERILQDPNLLQRLRERVRPPRRMADVAADMRELYVTLVTLRSSPHQVYP